MTEDRPLEETEEMAGDQIAALFYAEPNPRILESINGVLATLPAASREITLEATMNRLYQEKKRRQDYLSQALRLDGSNPDDQELDLIKMDESTLEGEPLEQLRYYKKLSQNLAEFELLAWLKEHKPLIDTISKLPTEKIKELKENCDDFTKQYFGQAAYERPDLVTLSPGLAKLLSEIGLTNQVDNYETPTEKARYLSLLSQVCAVLVDPDGAGLNYEQKLRAVAITAKII